MFIENLARGTGLSYSLVDKLVRSASHRYKKFSVPKRGGSGSRTLYQPSREIKLLQRWCVKEVISRLPVHAAAMAYRDRIGIRATADLHAHGRFLCRLDFTDFFPSITARDIHALFVENASRLLPHVEGDDDIQAFCNLTCRRGCLVIGAPSSPALSNAIMREFDDVLWASCQARLICYSRYADDLFFSSNTQDALRPVEDFVAEALRESRCPRLVVNQRKTVRSSMKTGRRVLGLVLSSEKKVSIGRKKKRYTRSLVFKAIGPGLEPAEVSRLNGMLSFFKSVEPSFLASLRKRYDKEKLRAAGVIIPAVRKAAASPDGRSREERQ